MCYGSAKDDSDCGACMWILLVYLYIGIGVSCCFCCFFCCCCFCYRCLSNNKRSILSGKMFFLFRARSNVLFFFFFWCVCVCVCVLLRVCCFCTAAAYISPEHGTQKTIRNELCAVFFSAIFVQRFCWCSINKSC